MDSSQFAALLNNPHYNGEKSLQPGERLQAEIVQINADTIFLHYGGKTEGLVARSEFQAPDMEDAKIGETVGAFYYDEVDREPTFTLRPGLSVLNEEILKNCFQNGHFVYGKVSGTNKGGFNVQLGPFQAFVNKAAMDLDGRGHESHIGKIYKFIVKEFGNGGRKLTLTRRPLLEQQREESVKKLSEALRVGQVIQVKVKNVATHAAFVEFAGLEAKIGLAELDHRKLKEASEVVSAGDFIDVKILELDWTAKKVKLSRKALIPDPWFDSVNFDPGAIITGTVSGIKPFGLFVKLPSGAEGLVPSSETGLGRDAHLEKKFAPGDAVKIQVMTIDRDNKKISLSIRRAQESADREELNQFMRQSDGASGAGQSLGDMLRKKLK